MLIFKDISDKKKVLEYVDENKLNDLVNKDGLYFGAFEDERMFGICEIHMTDVGVAIGLVHILPEYKDQGMEDALLRSLFNKLELRGVKQVYSSKKNSFLDRFGFRDSSDGYRCDLVAMFSRGCSCCGSDHHES